MSKGFFYWFDLALRPQALHGQVDGATGNRMRETFTNGQVFSMVHTSQGPERFVIQTLATIDRHR